VLADTPAIPAARPPATPEASMSSSARSRSSGTRRRSRRRGPAITGTPRRVTPHTFRSSPQA
jgi:hypothetical protein